MRGYALLLTLHEVDGARARGRLNGYPCSHAYASFEVQARNVANIYLIKNGRIVMNYRKTLSLAAAGLLTFSAVSQAGRIDVVNENKKALRIKIQAEGDKFNETLATYVKDIPAEHYSEFRVEATDLKGKSHYSIKGDTSPLTTGDKCQHLSVEKDYKVTFLNDAAGTTCVAEEVTNKIAD